MGECSVSTEVQQDRMVGRIKECWIEVWRRSSREVEVDALDLTQREAGKGQPLNLTNVAKDSKQKKECWLCQMSQAATPHSPAVVGSKQQQ